MAPVVLEKRKKETAEDAAARDERAWDEQMAGSLDVLEALHDEITADDEAGRTTPVNA